MPASERSFKMPFVKSNGLVGFQSSLQQCRNQSSFNRSQKLVGNAPVAGVDCTLLSEARDLREVIVLENAVRLG
jgi:hypothetical protein